jgi:hypothetical protein
VGLPVENLGQPDHGGIVWDEILAFWFILFFILPCSWLVQVSAFLIFRYFDIAKPGPIKVVDQYFKNWQPSPEQTAYAIWIRGFGVMVDDILAAYGYFTRAVHCYPNWSYFFMNHTNNPLAEGLASYLKAPSPPLKHSRILYRWDG